jgi:hypothetical protein
MGAGWPLSSGCDCGENLPPKRFAMARPLRRARECGVKRQPHQQEKGQAAHRSFGHGFPFSRTVWI